MREYHSQEELYDMLIPAMNVKLTKLKEDMYYDIKYDDIWNYLRDSKWKDSVNLTLGEMVNDIIHVNNLDLINYIKNKEANNIEGNV